MSYAGEARFRFDGPADVCSRYIPIARVLVERVSAMYNVGGTADAATHTTRLADGTAIKVTVFAQVPPIITITPVTGGGATATDTTISNGFYFYLHTYFGDEKLSGMTQYLPGVPEEAYAGNADDGGPLGNSPAGKWKTRPDPDSGLPGLRSYRRFLSRDLRKVDDYPRWLVRWERGFGYDPDDTAAPTTTYDSFYYINGNEISAPGEVVGAIKERDRDVVFTQTKSPLQIHRYDRDAVGEWALTWSATVPLVGYENITSLADTFEINPVGTEAMFLVYGGFTATGRYSENDSFHAPVLYKADLELGTITHVYGSSSDIGRTFEAEMVSATDGDFPDGTGFRLELHQSIEASVDTSATLRTDWGSLTYYTYAPRVGDNFHFGDSNPTTDGSSRIEVTSVSYDTDPFDSSGAIYTGSTSPEKGINIAISFTWVKSGTYKDVDEVTQNMTYGAGTHIEYICKGDPLLTDYYEEVIEEFYSRAPSPYYGYDRNGAQYYAYFDSQQTVTDYFTVVGGGGSILEDHSYSDQGTTKLIFVGGENNGRVVLWGDESYDYFYDDGMDGVSFGSDPDTFSGIDFVNGVTGSIRDYLYTEVFYPTTVPYGPYSESYVYGTGTDNANISQGGTFDAYTNAFFFDDFGFVYILEILDPGGPIVSTSASSTTFAYTGADAPGYEKFPYKDVFSEIVNHEGVDVAKYVAASNDDFGDGSYTSYNFYRLGGSGWGLASSSYDASSGLREYVYPGGPLADIYVNSDYNFLASDPFHNLIAVFGRGYDDPSWILRGSDYGYVWRDRDGVSSGDPRPLFFVEGDTLPETMSKGVMWGRIVSDLVVETKKYENESDAKNTRVKTYEDIYRPGE